MKLVRTLGSCAIALALSAGLGSTSVAAQDLTIRFAHVDPAGWQTSKKGAAGEMFKNYVEGQSGGDVAVELYPAGQLGNETELVQSVQDGTIRMTMVSGPFTKVCPAASVLDIPYMFSSAPVAWKVLDGEFGDKLRQHCLEETGLRILAYGETGFRNFTSAKQQIHSPEDLKGQKIRVMTVPLFTEMVKAMGGEPTPIPWPEVPSALATGVVDGQENPVSVIHSNKFYEVQKYLSLDQHVYGTDFILINEDFYQGLSPKNQSLLKNAAIAAGNMGRSIQQFNSAKGIVALQEEGMEVYKPTPDEIAKFRESAQPAVVEWLSGQIDETWINDLKSAVAEAEKGL